jgi:cyclopropane-fatty-acyl-phospholipid synthase
MGVSAARRRVESLLLHAGVRVNGDGAADVRVSDARFFDRVLSGGILGLGESYMDGWWHTDDLQGLLRRLIEARLGERIRTLRDGWLWLLSRVRNRQDGRRAFTVGEQHYDLGNDLFEAMLGPDMIYSCGYWRDALDLAAAQDAKLDLIYRKVGLAPEMRVLDIGCGWGEAIRRASQKCGTIGVGVTISREQAEHARSRCSGLPIDIRLMDYRAMDERFDRIFSIGMFEHVGVKNYRAFFEVARRCLDKDGLFVLHTVGGNISGNHTNAWIDRYIFPNSVIPSAAQISQAVEGLFIIEDWQNFGADYARTLKAWRSNFDEAWPRLSARYDERFRRMWHFYLDSTCANFAARGLHVWQLVLSPSGVRGGYVAPR